MKKRRNFILRKKEAEKDKNFLKFRRTNYSKSMKKYFLIAFMLLLGFIPSFAQLYEPSPEMLKARSEFQDRKFGLFIHWGLSSILGDGEWVMNNQNISVKDYTRLKDAFYPSKFDADKWVLAAKNAGMKYIIFITRHHDGFSNWDTQYSDWKITNTPYKKDVLKLLAEACKRHDMKLGLYYSQLDWYREDYPFETGRTGQGNNNLGRKGPGNYASYLQFMRNQLTELLTNYGEISSIWFDGHWDQSDREGKVFTGLRMDWQYDQIYPLIHQLQPNCMIGNNHHVDPIPGEDFQMFERDLPGENKAGLSFQKASDELPLETCETLNKSWGFNIADHNFKSKKKLIDLLVGAAGRNANFLLNVGPMPTGEIQPEFIEKLNEVGAWMKDNSESIYGTRGGPLSPQVWGVTTQKEKTVYVHFLSNPKEKTVYIPGNYKKGSAKFLVSGKVVEGKFEDGGVHLNCSTLPTIEDDIVVTLEMN